jgi:hypothetical protein
MTSEKQKFAHRLNEALDEAGLPRIGQGRQSGLAKMIDVGPQLAGKWLKGEDYPKTSQLVKIAKQLGVRSNWLLTGSGDKYMSEEEQQAFYESLRAERSKRAEVREGTEDPLVASGVLSREAFELAVAWMQLPATQRAAMQKVIVELSRAV